MNRSRRVTFSYPPYRLSNMERRAVSLRQLSIMPYVYSVQTFKLLLFKELNEAINNK